MKTEEIEINGKEYKVLIGQNSNENDFLIGSSEPDDLWFHFEKISGPHIVLQCASYSGVIPIEVLKEIGNKLYVFKKSADKNEKIMYTEIKNVRKTKVKGTVTVKKYNLI